jgi:hypothetical protein
MKRNRKALLLSMTLVMALLSGCGSGASSQTASVTASSAAAESQENANFDMDLATSDTAAEVSSSVYRSSDAKLIRTANLNLQTTQFDQAAARLEQLVTGVDGYFQEASVYSGSYRNANANRSGEYTIRVPAERYDAFLEQTGELGYVTYRNETSENIGEQYYDTQARLKTQQTKQERLLSLLEQAESMEDIIALESALSDVEYQIEQLSSTLNRYDGLVDYATIYLSLQEVYEVNEQSGVTAGLGARIAAGLASSGKGLVTGSQELLVWLSYHIFGVAVLAVVISAMVVVGRRSLRKKGLPKDTAEKK